MSDFGAAPRLDWTLRGTPFEAASYKWGLPLLPHLYEFFAQSAPLPSFEACMDRLLKQKKGSLDRHWVKRMGQKTDVCLHSRLTNLAAESEPDEIVVSKLQECISETSPKWLAFAIGFSSHHAHRLQVPLPLPRTREMVELLSRRVRHLRAVLGCEIALTNVASMFRYSIDSLNETEFWLSLCEASGAKIFFDIPAYFVTLQHQGLDFGSELGKFPLEQVMSVRIGALALSQYGDIDAECGSLSTTHWALLEDVLNAMPEGGNKSIFLKWFEPLVSAQDLVGEIINGQSTLRRLGEI